MSRKFKKKTLYSLDLGDLFSLPGSSDVYQVEAFVYENGVRVCIANPVTLKSVKFDCSTVVV